MSGGSLNYLYGSDLDGRERDYEEALEALRQRGHELPAQRVERLLKLLREAQLLHNDLREVLRAVEWRISGDFGDDQLSQVCAIEIQKYGWGTLAPSTTDPTPETEDARSRTRDPAG
jgi:hypothetical protein